MCGCNDVNLYQVIFKESCWVITEVWLHSRNKKTLQTSMIIEKFFRLWSKEKSSRPEPDVDDDSRSHNGWLMKFSPSAKGREKSLLQMRFPSIDLFRSPRELVNLLCIKRFAAHTESQMISVVISSAQTFPRSWTFFYDAKLKIILRWVIDK